MNHPIVIGAIVGVTFAVVIAVFTRRRAGHWRYGTALVVGSIVSVFTGVPAIWYGWVACVYGAIIGYVLGLVTIREAIRGR